MQEHVLWTSLKAGMLKTLVFKCLIVYPAILVETNFSFLRKSRLYGLKTEVSIYPTGSGINCNDHSPGSGSDIAMFCKHIFQFPIIYVDLESFFL